MQLATVDINEVLEKIHAAGDDALVYVGCDSSKTRYHTTYVTVVVIHYGAKNGTGSGCKLFAWAEKRNNYPSLKQKLLHEVNLAVTKALELLAGTPEQAGLDPDMLEVHADINPNPKHRSYVAYKEATAWIRGQGLTEKFKPDALAASSASDFIGRASRSTPLLN